MIMPNNCESGIGGIGRKVSGLDLVSLLGSIFGGKIISVDMQAGECFMGSLEGKNCVGKDVKTMIKTQKIKERVGGWDFSNPDNTIFKLIMPCENFEELKRVLDLKKVIKEVSERLQSLKEDYECAKKLLSLNSLDFNEVSPNLQEIIGDIVKKMSQVFQDSAPLSYDEEVKKVLGDLFNSMGVDFPEVDLLEMKKLISEMQDNPNQWFIDEFFNTTTSLELVKKILDDFRKGMGEWKETDPADIQIMSTELKEFEKQLVELLEQHPQFTDIEEIPTICLNKDELIEAITDFADKMAVGK